MSTEPKKFFITRERDHYTTAQAAIDHVKATGEYVLFGDEVHALGFNPDSGNFDADGLLKAWDGSRPSPYFNQPEHYRAYLRHLRDRLNSMDLSEPTP